MAVFLARSNLSRGCLRLYLNNDLGYPVDAHDVRWTVFAADGVQISGKNLIAIRAKVGEYYAPWFSDAPTGNYSIVWTVVPESGASSRTFTEQFFVVDPPSYQCCPKPCKTPDPLPGGLTYLVGTWLGRGDLPLFLKNDSGLPEDAFAVFWTIYNSRNCPISLRTAASHAALGEYYVTWLVSPLGGNYIVQWDYMKDQNSPLQSVRQGFSVLNPTAFRCGGRFMQDFECNASPVQSVAGDCNCRCSDRSDSHDRRDSWRD